MGGDHFIQLTERPAAHTVIESGLLQSSGLLGSTRRWGYNHMATPEDFLEEAVQAEEPLAGRGVRGAQGTVIQKSPLEHTA